MNQQFFTQIYSFWNEIYLWRRILWNLSLQDFKERYLGSYLGIIWAFVHPFITILIYWFVFDIGLKSSPVQNFPFSLWLIAGISPWFFFSDAVIGETNSIIEKSYLVKKVVFRVSLLPITKIISAAFVHLFFLVLTAFLFMADGYFLSFYVIQVVYYLLCLFMLLLGIGWFTSTLVIFIRDTTPFVSVIIQFGFWLTPIVWSQTLIPEQYRDYLKLNPMFYITDGYRDAFINHIWFWEKPLWSLYFWCFTGALLLLGMTVFKKMRPHFADVL